MIDNLFEECPYSVSKCLVELFVIYVHQGDWPIFFLFIIVSLPVFGIRVILAQVVLPLSRLYFSIPYVRACIKFTSNHAEKIIATLKLQ